ncbi:MAG: hypothetical protein ABFS46_20550, partial [Myxococcota bacterium]
MSERDEQLAELALGILDEEARVELERDLAGSPEARDELDRVEATLESLALAADSMQPSPDRRAALLRSLEPDARFPAYVERVGVLFDLAQSRVRELLDAVS